MRIFDTDILIFCQRGHAGAARRIDETPERGISVVTYMELAQGARSKVELGHIRSFLADFRFRMLPLTENIGYRASIYLEEYGLRHGLGMADCLIAATAVENDLELVTSNRKHFAPIGELKVDVFKP
jgi:predicted nucleic acid-binding protein